MRVFFPLALKGIDSTRTGAGPSRTPEQWLAADASNGTARRRGPATRCSARGRGRRRAAGSPGDRCSAPGELGGVGGWVWGGGGFQGGVGGWVSGGGWVWGGWGVGFRGLVVLLGLASRQPQQNHEICLGLPQWDTQKIQSLLPPPVFPK